MDDIVKDAEEFMKTDKNLQLNLEKKRRLKKQFQEKLKDFVHRSWRNNVRTDELNNMKKKDGKKLSKVIKVSKLNLKWFSHTVRDTKPLVVL